MAPSSETRDLERLQLKIGGMQCSFCVSSVEKALGRLDGVHDVGVSLAHEQALVRYDPEWTSQSTVTRALSELGYPVRDPDKVKAFEEQQAELRVARRRLWWAAALALAALGLMAFMWSRMGVYADGAFTDTRRPAMAFGALALALATLLGPGGYIMKKAYHSLRRGILNQHVLMEAAALGGLIGGLLGTATLFFPAVANILGADFPVVHFFAVAVFVTAYHVLSEWTSLLVRARASASIQRLLELQPMTARVVRDGGEEEVPVEEVAPGDRVRVRPGESLPVDGVVVEGTSGVDQSLVTGESLPLNREPGDEVIGGSVNQTGALVVEVTRVGTESFLQQVAAHIQEARALKPGILLLVDRVLKYFVPGVIAAAALAFVIWTVGAWLVAGTPDLGRAVLAALAALVMGYPCALGMATPLAMIRGGGIAARQGILMRSGEAFQVFKDVRKVVLDKTGTLTRGRPTLARVVPMDAGDEAAVLRAAAAAESASEHPLARAIVRYAFERGIDIDAAAGFEAAPGRGVRATVDGRRVLVGAARHLRAHGVDTAAARAQQAELEERGHTVVLVARDGALAGLIAIGDAVKADAPAAVARMRAEGLEPVLVTGDNERTARAVAAEVGIDQVLAGVLPQDKASEVRRLQRQGHRVAMVGDGINDAPALTQADVGIAIGAGTDIAIESADVILVSERLDGIVGAYRIGRESFTKTVQNVALAFAFNGIGVPAAMTGLVHPIWAMVAMAASVSVVLLNSFAGQVLSRRRTATTVGGSTQTFNLAVPSIRCAGCIETVRAAVDAVPGATAVSGDVGLKQVQVELDPSRADRDSVAEAIRRSGHVCDDTADGDPRQAA